MSAQSSKPSRTEKANAAKERVAALRAEEARRERKQKLLIYGVAGVVVLAIVALVAWQLVRDSEEKDQLAESIEDLQVYDIPDNSHVEGTVDYEHTPPAGGQHADVPLWQNCGIYDAPVGNENAVHSLEHGAVWITYQTDLPEDQVDALRDIVEGLDSSQRNFVILSPFEDLPSPVVASAWERQVFLDGADDFRLEQFLDQFVVGAQAPEPGASCTGGVGEPIG